VSVIGSFQRAVVISCSFLLFLFNVRHLTPLVFNGSSGQAFGAAGLTVLNVGPLSSSSHHLYMYHLPLFWLGVLLVWMQTSNQEVAGLSPAVMSLCNNSGRIFQTQRTFPLQCSVIKFWPTCGSVA